MMLWKNLASRQALFPLCLGLVISGSVGAAATASEDVARLLSKSSKGGASTAEGAAPGSKSPKSASSGVGKGAKGSTTSKPTQKPTHKPTHKPTPMPTPQPTFIFPDIIDLPEGFCPEGIAIKGNTFYVSSFTTGDIIKGDLKTGDYSLFVSAPNATGAGLSIDGLDRLWVAVINAKGRVYDGNDGTLLMEYTLASPFSSFINDVIVAENVAYFTDSGTKNIQGFPGTPRVFVVPIGSDGTLQDNIPGVVGEVPVNNTVDVTFPNLNGIEKLPSSNNLIVCHTSLGKLLSVDPASGMADDLGLDVLGCDGLVRRGEKIYVVGVTEITEVDFSGSDGPVISDTYMYPMDPIVGNPTTAGVSGNRLYFVDNNFCFQSSSARSFVRKIELN